MINCYGENQERKHFVDTGRMNTCIYIAFVIVQPMITLGFKCYRVEDSVQYSPGITSQIRNREECIDQFGLDGFPCEDRNTYTYIKVECLICGSKAAHFTEDDSLCPNSYDHPGRFLTCSQCLNYTNSCNNGTMYCLNNPSYGEDMRCRCKDGYTGDYCENEIIKVYRMCRCSGHISSQGRPLCSDFSADRCRIELFDGNTCICENIRNERPTNMPDCSNINEEISVEDEPSLIIDNNGNAGQTQTQPENRACKGYTWNVFYFVQFILLLLRVP